jgi:hypothetical protein
MKAVYALYTDPDAAQRAVDELRTLGVAERDIVVMSSERSRRRVSHRDGARGCTGSRAGVGSPA